MRGVKVIYSKKVGCCTISLKTTVPLDILNKNIKGGELCNDFISRYLSWYSLTNFLLKEQCKRIIHTVLYTKLRV